MQNRRETQPYNPHGEKSLKLFSISLNKHFFCTGLMSHIAVPPQQTPQPQAPNSIAQRPNSAQNPVQYNYEPTPSPIG